MPKIVGTVTGPSSSGRVNVKTFRAVGDGSNDDTSAFIAAFAASASGTSVFAPKGTYRITGTLEVPAGVSLELDQGAKIVTGASFSVIAIKLNEGCTLSGGEVDGSTSTASTVVEIQGNDVTVQGVKVTSSTGDTTHGINASNGYHRTKIRNCRVINGYCSIRLAALGANPVASPYIGVEVTGNLVDPSAQVGTAAANPNGIMVLGWVANSREYRGPRIENNHCIMRTTAGAGQWSRGIGITPRMCQGGAVVGNTTQGGDLGISLDASNSILATGNTTRGFYSIGIEVAACTHAAVAGNVVDGSGVSLNAGMVSGGGSNYVTFSGNTVTGMGAATNGCIYLTQTGTTRTVITGNTLLMGTSTQGGVYLNGGTGELIVVGNIIDGASGVNTRGVYATSATGVKGTVAGNYFIGLGLACIYFNAVSGFSKLSVTGNSFNGLTPITLTGGASAGSGVVFSGNDDGVDYQDYANNISSRLGAGTPEGSVTAGIGSVYRRTNGGSSTTLYVKESGTGNTGWVAK